MNENPMISVIIPVYNVEGYIREAVDSVLRQTYKDFEIIVIDDGSTDNSMNIIKMHYSNKDNIFILHQKNSGQSIARNKGLEIAKGKYIIFLDSDDYLELDCFEVLINIFEKKQIDLIRFSGMSFGRENLNLTEFDYGVYFEENKIYSNTEFNKINIKAFSPSPVLYMIDAKLLRENKIFFKENIIHEDELFTTKLFYMSNNSIYCKNFFYNRRVRENSTMTTQSKEQLEKSFVSLGIILDELLLLKNEANKNIEFLNSRIQKIELEMVLKKIVLKRKIELSSRYRKIHPIKKMKYIFIKYAIKFKAILRRYKFVK